MFNFLIKKCNRGNKFKKIKIILFIWVTGSGKSEVYFRCAQKVIDEGKQVIYLVPEITLTHQLIQQSW